MSIDKSSSRGTHQPDITDNIFFSVVRSLYADPTTLAVGVVSLFLAAMLAFYKTGETFHLVFAGLFVVGGLGRIVLSRFFENAICQPISRAQYERWETYYALSGSSYVGILCSWFTFSIFLSDDKFIHLMSTSLCLCYLVGIIGRNFASKKVVDLQVYTSAFLFTLGLALHGEIYYI